MFFHVSFCPKNSPRISVHKNVLSRLLLPQKFAPRWAPLSRTWGGVGWISYSSPQQSSPRVLIKFFGTTWAFWPQDLDSWSNYRKCCSHFTQPYCFSLLYYQQPCLFVTYIQFMYIGKHGGLSNKTS